MKSYDKIYHPAYVEQLSQNDTQHLSCLWKLVTGKRECMSCSLTFYFYSALEQTPEFQLVLPVSHRNDDNNRAHKYLTISSSTGGRNTGLILQAPHDKGQQNLQNLNLNLFTFP